VPLFVSGVKLPLEATEVDARRFQDDVLRLYLNKRTRDEIRSCLKI
jgi:hypothetical protein